MYVLTISMDAKMNDWLESTSKNLGLSRNMLVRQIVKHKMKSENHLHLPDDVMIKDNFDMNQEVDFIES